MTAFDLAAIRERANNATEGPWEAEQDRDYGYYVSTHWSHTQDGLDPELIADLVPHADAEFIANAREDIPALLDLVDTLTAQLAAVRELLDGTIGEDDECTISRDELRAALDGDQ